MYESRFGITGPPFQLSPDPNFYYDSSGHHRALSELRRGLTAASGFVLISGEIGAGKTTIVRTLLSELDTRQLAVAHVVSTQLDAGELLGSALIGFGLPTNPEPGEDLSARLIRFLSSLDNEARRAVLIIDEAQNLRPDAFEQLVAIATQRTRLPLQLCLVGQPELRDVIQAEAMASLRALITVSCHLGPIEPGETGAYVEHRLRKVGWTGIPAFLPGAFHEIHRWSAGIPRRINLLCNRLMLSCFLASQTEIGPALVEQIARELRAEIGEAGADPPPSFAQCVPTARAAHAPQTPEAMLTPSEPGPLLCVVATLRDHIRAAALMHAFAARRELHAAKLVRIYDNDALELCGALLSGLDPTSGMVTLGVAQNAGEEGLAELRRAFGFVVDHVLARTVIVFDAGEAALVCAGVASDKGVPVVHIGAGLRANGHGRADAARKQTDQLAALLYTTELRASEVLANEGVPPERVHCAGNLLMDALQMTLRVPTDLSSRESPSSIMPLIVDRTGYGLVVLEDQSQRADGEGMLELLAMLRDASRDIRLVWPVPPAIGMQLEKLQLDGFIGTERILRLPTQPYPDYLALMRSATCVITDTWGAQEEATALGVPCLTIGSQAAREITVSTGSNTFIGTNSALLTRAVWECIFNGGKKGRTPELWDGRTGKRVAGYLSAWLPGMAQEGSRLSPLPPQECEARQDKARVLP